MTAKESTSATRRALLGAALGGAAAVAAGSLRPLDVRAANGESALLGLANASTAPTSFENGSAGGTSLIGVQAAGGVGVLGSAAGGTGIHGTSDTKAGVVGTSTSQAGVWASSGDADLATLDPNETGVYGYASTSFYSNGVWGDSVDGVGVFATGYWGVYGYGAIAVQGDAGVEGVGVYGWTGNDDAPDPSPGVGVYARAESLDQVALQVVGKLKFNRAGVKEMNRSSKTFTMAGVTSSSQVLVNLQTSVSGLYVRAVKPQSGRFTVYLSKSPGKTVKLSYMVING